MVIDVLLINSKPINGIDTFNLAFLVTKTFLCLKVNPFTRYSWSDAK